MKRFWETALAVPRLEGGFGVVLDGRPLRLPGGLILATHSPTLAEAIAAALPIWNIRLDPLFIMASDAMFTWF